MGVQAFYAELAIERLDECIVGRFAGSREVERDATLIGPQIKITRDELGTLIDADRRWKAELTPDPFQAPQPRRCRGS